MKEVKFKGDHAKIKIQGRDPITNENLTWETYTWLVEQNPAYEAFFEVTEHNKPNKNEVSTKKPKGNDLGAAKE